MNHQHSSSLLRSPAANWLLRATLMLLAASASIVRSHAAFDMFLKFYNTDGSVIPGESNDATYKGSDGWFELQSFNLGIQNAVTIGSSSGGAGAGKATFQDFTLTKVVDSMSPAIFKSLATGAKFQSARLVLRKAGATGKGTPAAFLQYEFNLVFVTIQHWSGTSGDDTPTESVTLKVGEVKISYSPTKPNGTLGTPITGEWNQVLNSNAFDPLPDGP